MMLITDRRKESIPVTTDRRASTSARELKEMLETQKRIVERVAVGCIAWALTLGACYLFVAAWLG